MPGPSSSMRIRAARAPSVSPAEAQKSARAVRDALSTVPEVVSVISKVGRPDDGTDPKIFNSAEFFVETKPEADWPKGKTKPMLIRAMDATIGRLPGLEPSFSQPIRDNALESISQIDGQIVIKIQGDDFDTIKQIARQIRLRIAGVAGVTRSFVDRDGRLPQFRIDIDRATAARYGVNVADMQDVVESALAGKATSELWEGERHFSVVVRLEAEQRDLPSLPDVLVAGAGGIQVPLSQLAKFQVTEGAMNISRENGQRVAAIGVFIRDRDMGSVVADMQKLVDAEIRLPAGYTIAWSGEFENQQRAMARLSWVVPLSILLIFLLLFDAFGSLASAALIIANIPLAMIGGHRRAVADRDPAVGVGRHRLHRAVRSGGAQRGGDGVGLQRARGRTDRLRGNPQGDSRERADAPAHGADDCDAGDAGAGADGAVARHRRRNTAPARDRGDRRAGQRDAADAGGAARALSDDRAALARLARLGRRAADALTAAAGRRDPPAARRRQRAGSVHLAPAALAI
jgi:hypothetical protein